MHEKETHMLSYGHPVGRSRCVCPGARKRWSVAVVPGALKGFTIPGTIRGTIPGPLPIAQLE